MCVCVCVFVHVSCWIEWLLYFFFMLLWPPCPSGDLLQLGEFSVLRFNHPHEAKKLREKQHSVSAIDRKTRTKQKYCNVIIIFLDI